MIKLNGTVFTGAFAMPYTVSYKKVRGPNSGYMMDGSYTDDVRAVKAVISCTTQPLTATAIQSLLSIMAETYVTVYYFDPRQNAYRTMTAMPSEPSPQYKGATPDGADIWLSGTITFTEK